MSPRLSVEVSPTARVECKHCRRLAKQVLAKRRVWCEAQREQLLIQVNNLTVEIRSLRD